MSQCHRMKSRMHMMLAGLLLSGLFAVPLVAAPPAEGVWPPPLKGANADGTITFNDPRFLDVPQRVRDIAEQEHAAPFTMAKTAPTVDLAYHDDLPNQALNGTGWSVWGDIGVALSGKVYSGMGDHGDDAGGKALAYIYEWDPQSKRLTQVVDLNAITPREHGEPAWAKVHSRVDVAPDGMVYFSGTLNDSNAANQPKYKWSEAIPAAQIYRYDPSTGETEVVANLPDARATSTSLLDTERMIWWCTVEAGPNALWGYDIRNGKVAYKSADGAVRLNRNFAVGRDGSVIFNGVGGLWKYDPEKNDIAATGVSLPDGHQMRASTHQASDGSIYGVTMGSGGGQLFRYNARTNKLDMLGPDFLTGNYTTVIEMSSDEKFLYYLPGAHGGAFDLGTPVIQYNLATGERKVLAFLRNVMEADCDYVPAGTYGIKLSADDATLYVSFNGHAGDSIRPEAMRAFGFGLTSFAAIHIPESER